MKVKVSDEHVEVLLSKRNLDTLQELWLAYEEGNALPVLHRFDVSANRYLHVAVEHDDIHYAGRRAQEGRHVGIGPEDIRAGQRRIDNDWEDT